MMPADKRYAVSTVRSFFRDIGFPPLGIDPVFVFGVSVPALFSLSLKAGLGLFRHFRVLFE
jgi:hypothetical protein